MDPSRHMQKELTDYFDFLRQGKARQWRARDRVQEIRDTIFPKPGPYQNRVLLSGRVPHTYTRGERYQATAGGSRPPSHIQDVVDRIQISGLQVVKILGYGGFGVATLFEETGRRSHKVVIKIDLGGRESIRGETANYEMMRGARHILCRLRAFSTPDMLALEFMERGTLGKWIEKAAATGRQDVFPNLVLWKIFECLVRGVIALSYPNRWRAEAAGNPNRAVTETVSGQPTEVLVHFDIDPSNILMGDFSPGEHRVTPVVKISDLGVARTFTRPPENFDIWSCRMTGKYRIATPEQFTEEWDYYPDPRPFAKAAGRYGTRTNVYQVALVMWSLITQHYPPDAPQESPYVFSQNARTYAGTTFGGWLLASPRYVNVDLDLLKLIVRCMSHNVDDRPGMLDLEVEVGRKASATPDSTTLQFIRDFFEGTPPFAARANRP